MSEQPSMGFQYGGFVAAPIMAVIFLFYAVMYLSLLALIACIVIPMIAFPIVGLVYGIGATGLFEAIPGGLARGPWAPFQGLALIVVLLGAVAGLVALHFVLSRWQAFRVVSWIARLSYLNGILIWILGGYVGGIRHAWIDQLGKRIADLNFDMTPFVRVTLEAGFSGMRYPYLLLTGGLSAEATDRLLVPVLVATGLSFGPPLLVLGLRLLERRRGATGSRLAPRFE
jgi:hypothetical protein